MSRPDITVEGIGKRYRIGVRRQRCTTFREAIVQAMKAPARRFHRLGAQDNGDDTIWAVRDVSFEVQPGEVVGIIGRNGAGKTTLLKILSRITEPTEGVARLRGRVASLLEVGTGFHPELTGRENIYLNGAILGMKKAEIDRKFDTIVAFSEIEKFLDTPVKRYSSGMYVRLAFAVAAHLEPEILIVDEVLAVGDAEFQKKCLGKMEDVSTRQGRTVLFVSHNMAAVQRLCSRGIVIRNGAKAFDGPAAEAVGKYIADIELAGGGDLRCRTSRRGRGRVRLEEVTIRNTSLAGVRTPQTGMPLQLVFVVSKRLPGLKCTFSVYDHIGTPLASFSAPSVSHIERSDGRISPAFVWETDELLLTPGHYRVDVAIRSAGGLEDHVEGAAIFDVAPGVLRGQEIRTSNAYGAFTMPHRWLTP